MDEWDTSPKAKVEKSKAAATDEWGDLSKSKEKIKPKVDLSPSPVKKAEIKDDKI